MFTYANYKRSTSLGLGAAVEPNKAKALLQVMGNRYPLMTGSCTLVGGCSPALDDKADFWSFQAVSKEASGGSDLTVYAQLQSLAPGAKALVDIESANKILEGNAGPLSYVIAKNDAVCKQLSGAGASLQELPSVASVVSPPAEATKGIKGKAVVGALVAAAAGALVAGPAGAVIGGGLVGYYLQTSTA